VNGRMAQVRRPGARAGCQSLTAAAWTTRAVVIAR
jgi:hypothetical protein